MGGETKYFNPIPLFILFREAIEASIVVSVLLTFLSRSTPSLKVQVWWGVAFGVGISLILGAVFAILYYTAQNNLFQGQNQFIFKGVVCWIACIFITILAFAMLRYQGWEAKWERKLKTQGVQKLVETKAAETAPKDMEEVQVVQVQPPSTSQCQAAPAPAAPGSPRSSTSLTNKPNSSQDNAAALDTLSSSGNSLRKLQPPPAAAAAAPPSSSSHTDDTAAPAAAEPRTWRQRLRTFYTALTSEYSLFFVVFFTVLREGLESVVFLFGVGNTAPAAIPISGLIGITCGVLVGVVLYYSGKQVKDIKWLLFVFAAVLFFIAAGAAENGANYLMKGGMFGTYVVPQYLLTLPETAAITTTLWGRDGFPPAPSADNGGAAAAFNDGDEIVTIGVTDLNDGYIYTMTQVQPWWQAKLWDLSGCCADTDDKNKFLALCKAIFGYNAQPTFIDAIFYMGYWLMVLSWGMWKWHKGTLLDADHKYNKMIKEQQEQAARDKLASLDSGIECNYVLKPEVVPGATAAPAVAVEVVAPAPAKEEQAEQGKVQAAP